MDFFFFFFFLKGWIIDWKKTVECVGKGEGGFFLAGGKHGFMR